MIGKEVEFVNEQGIFVSGIVITKDDCHVIVKDTNGKLWHGHPSKIFPFKKARQLNLNNA